MVVLAGASRHKHTKARARARAIAIVSLAPQLAGQQLGLQEPARSTLEATTVMIIETIKMNKLALSNLGGLLAAVCLLAAALSKASPLAMEAGKLTWPAPYYEQPGRGQLVGWLSPGELLCCVL